jgi:hypothetical protein
MSICAYCKLDKPSTKEHIIPAFLYRFQKQMENKILGWNDIAAKMLSFEAMIRDVCASCNGGVLSMLDASGKEMLEKSEVLVHNNTKSNIGIYYDYDLLTRWLLKLSFNSSRVNRKFAHIFEHHIQYMLVGKPRPQKNELSIVVYMAKAESVKEVVPGLEPYMQLAEGSNLLNPFLVRITYAATPSEAPYEIRGIFFGPLMFFLILFREGISPGLAASETKKFQKRFIGSLILDPKRGHLNLHAGSATWLDLYTDQVLRAKARGYRG